MHDIADPHLLENILNSNDELAQHNREHFDEMGVFVVNMMSAPGAGKTTLIGRTLQELRGLPSIVVEGDMVGEVDAERLRQQGIEAFQISTGRNCHLDAALIARFLHEVPLERRARMIVIENVGNLVCPAEFPLGEHRRIVLLSVTEGDDKPVKYPVIFRNCDAVVFTKTDLLSYVDFDLERAMRYVHNINPSARTFAVSVKTGQGIRQWADWLHSEIGEYAVAAGVDDVHCSAR